jgi:hypothetical protein
LSLSATNFNDLRNYRDPLLASFNFKVPRSAITGGWETRIPQDTIKPPRVFNVNLTFRDDGSYVYSVVQSETPRWQLTVSGTYTIAPPQQNIDETVAVLNLTASLVQFASTDPSAVQDADLTRLYYEGFPRATAQTLELQSQRQGNFYLRRTDRPAGNPVAGPIGCNSGSHPANHQQRQFWAGGRGARKPGLDLRRVWGEGGKRVDSASSREPVGSYRSVQWKSRAALIRRPESSQRPAPVRYPTRQRQRNGHHR